MADNNPLAYPLEEVIGIKQRRVEEAEREVILKEKELKKQQEILAEKKAARDKVRQHRDDKLTQLRKAMDEGSTSPKYQQMRSYLKIVKEKLVTEDKKVAEQQEQVEIAEKNLEVAKLELKQKRKEVDKLEEHKVEWLKEARKEVELEEAKEQDEMGSVMFLTRMRREK